MRMHPEDHYTPPLPVLAGVFPVPEAEATGNAPLWMLLYSYFMTDSLPKNFDIQVLQDKKECLLNH